MQAFQLEQLAREQADSGQAYVEFLRVPDLSIGLYQPSVGGSDPQSPHTEDEVYYVLRGKAKIRVAAEEQAVEAGSIIYVTKHVEHRFFSIEEDLTVLVFFAPAEYTNKTKQITEGVS